MPTLDEIKEELKQNQQSHLLQFQNEMTNDELQEFLGEIKEIDLEEVNRLFQIAINPKQDEYIDNHMEPVPVSQVESEERSSPETLRMYRDRGLLEISEGHVGVLLMAGGQGTRLGVEYPKGMYSVGLPSGKTLFQIQAERIKKLQDLAKTNNNGKDGKITWFIMTSGPTDEATDEFFTKHNYFGLDEKNVVMFKQGLLPCFDFDGKIILEEKNRIAMAPDGNGGIYRAMAKNGILNEMERRGIKYVHAYCVDNILVRLGDPVFIGYCVEKNSECAAKVVKKARPNEQLGVVCKVDDLYQVVEYSEISEHLANLRDDEGNLVFNAGSICNHFFSTEFLQRISKDHEKELKLHVAKKKVKYVDSSGVRTKPKTPNGIKIEKFVFDVFQFSERFFIWEVSRESEFSAMKNSDDVGIDCPSTAKRDLLALHKSYIERNGGKVIGSEVEISPLLSYAGEGLEEIVSGKVFTSPTILRADSELKNDVSNGY